MDEFFAVACEAEPMVSKDQEGPRWVQPGLNLLKGDLQFGAGPSGQAVDVQLAPVDQIIRLKARMLEPEALIQEADNLSALGEGIPFSMLPEIVERLFETGQGPRARETVLAKLEGLDAKSAARVAWVCYRGCAYDLACALFLLPVAENLSNFKYLRALESAARKSNRLPQVLEAYQALALRAAHLYWRLRLLGRRPQK